MQINCIGEVETQNLVLRIKKYGLIECLKKNVPSDVPGIAFLSGGQANDLATAHLNEINKKDTDWNVTFSYGRALQQDALKAWSGNLKNTQLAQQALLSRAKANSLATGFNL